MTQTLSDTRVSVTAITCAQQAATWNFEANLRSLRELQSLLVHKIHDIAVDDLEWIFARDGTLTALDGAGRWWSGCSLPTRAAKFMFEKADLSGIVICMLTPAHAAQVRVVLDRIQSGQALLILIPDLLSLRVLLACDDFSAEIAARRLYFAWGETWETELNLLLEENSGLATPSQFVRPILADSSLADALMAPAQKIFGEHATRRAEKMAAVRRGWHRSTLRKICVVAPSQFRLWDGSGVTLADVMEEGKQGVEVLRFDSDNPLSTSPLALAMAAANCNALVTPNLGRADLPELAPDDMPWATWLTIPRIPSAAKAGKHDSLLVADPAWKKLAVERGWNASRVYVAGWPDNAKTPLMTSLVGSASRTVLPARQKTIRNADPTRHAQGNLAPHLAIISDTRPLDPPAHILEYSSHRLLWEAIVEELLRDPFCIGESADNYLAQRIARAGLAEDGFDRGAFLDGVIRHAYQQGIANLLIGQNIALRIYGRGWSDIDSLSQYAAGPIDSREQLHAAAQSSRALFHVWPASHAHAIESLGKPVLRGDHRESFVRDARLAVDGKLTIPKPSIEPLTAEGIVAAVSI